MTQGLLRHPPAAVPPSSLRQLRRAVLVPQGLLSHPPAAVPPSSLRRFRSERYRGAVVRSGHYAGRARCTIDIAVPGRPICLFRRTRRPLAVSMPSNGLRSRAICRPPGQDGHVTGGRSAPAMPPAQQGRSRDQNNVRHGGRWVLVTESGDFSLIPTYFMRSKTAKK